MMNKRKEKVTEEKYLAINEIISECNYYTYLERGEVDLINQAEMEEKLRQKHI